MKAKEEENENKGHVEPRGSHPARAPKVVTTPRLQNIVQNDILENSSGLENLVVISL
jgi:hypothetical protein